MSHLLPAAWLLLAIASLGLYLSSRHQRLLAKPLPAGAARFISAVLMVAALVLLFGRLQAATAIYVYVIALMLFLVAWPFLGTLSRRGARAERS